MSAIDSTLKVLVRFFKSNQVPMLDGSFYFETGQLLHNCYGKFFLIERSETYEDLFRMILQKNYSLIFLESLNINSPKSILDLEQLVENLNLYNGPLVLVVDTTAEVKNFDSDYLLRRLNREVLLFEVKSGIKLMQLGLELSNVGFLYIKSNSKNINLERIKSSLVAFRALTGTSILPYEEEILCNEIFCSDITASYVDKLKLCCRNFYDDIKINPDLDINFGELSVFLIIKLKEQSFGEYKQFIDNLDKYLKKKRIKYHYWNKLWFSSTTDRNN